MANNIGIAKLALLSAAVALSLALSPTAAANSEGIVSVDAGKSLVVSHTLHLTDLTIANNAQIAAPKGYSLTLTVDGIGTPIVPGTYKGNVVLTVTKDIVVQFHWEQFKRKPDHFRTAIYVDNGSYQPAKSVAAEVVGGTVTNSAAKDVAITSNQETFNGIIVTGNSKYSIDNPVINLTGNGANDFEGFGVGILSKGNANVTVNNAKITTKGAARSAIFVGGHSTMTINNSTIQAKNGVLPSDYKFTLDMAKMMEVPWMLGLTGNARTTLLVEYGTLYFNHDHIVAQGWGALSTDAPNKLRLYANDSTIDTIDSGYGSYSIGDSQNVFSHCVFNVADMALIMANGGSGTFTDGTVVNSKRFGVTMHSWAKHLGTLTIDKGSVFNTKSTLIQVKGVGVNIIVDNAKLNAGNGIILQAMVNDDPMAPKPKAGINPPVKATFKNVALIGDILNSRTEQGDLVVNLNHATVTGAISTATAVWAKGVPATQKTYYLIGDVKNTLGATSNKFGLGVSLDGQSAWVIDKTSYLTGLTLAKGAKISAPKGHKVKMTVDGVAKSIDAGTYKGKIVLDVVSGG